MRMGIKRWMGVVSMMAAAAAVGTLSKPAEARWREAADCLKAIAGRQVSRGAFAWGLNCGPAGGGTFKVVHAVEAGSVAVPYWRWDEDLQHGRGTSIALHDQMPWVISVDNIVWYKY